VAVSGPARVEVLQWARTNGCGWGIEPCSAVAFGRHLAMLQWLRENGCPWKLHDFLATAGNADVEEWIGSQLSR
jgi:hypothetical protein